jgi:sigma-B regulation protein RsbU (phosphoserine phosphatase)
MTESAALIASGNLNICLNLKRGDEIGELGDSFNLMVEKLAIANQERDRLHAEVLKKEKLEQEIRLAAQIQQSFLPVSFPWSPLYRTNARSVAADVVGGDFYDFVELSENQIGIVIGDVAGRGIAAAVYMARVISDFRAVALRTESPREALEKLNHQLFSRSTRGIFVTMTYLVLDSARGELKYSSGGHLPALLRKGGTGKVEILDEDSGFPLGIALRANLGERSMKLEPDDELLLVTDGVVEGLCACHDVFNFDKLVEIFQYRRSHENGMVDAVFEEIARASSAGVQQDDMTVLTLGWKTERNLVPTL